jgi:stage III sporulation protein AH
MSASLDDAKIKLRRKNYMKFHKRQLILAALVLALGAAVYLNWQFTDNKSIIATNASSSQTSSEKQLGAAAYVNAGESSETSSKTESTASGSSGKLTTSANEYFASARLTRQQARDAASETLKISLNDANTKDELKQAAIDQSAQMAKNMEQEANVENLIKAKGFVDCVAFIQNGECNVAVASTGLLESEAVIIKDIAANQTGLQYAKIKIVEVK